jgi:hypothetical protein
MKFSTRILAQITALEAQLVIPNEGWRISARSIRERIAGLEAIRRDLELFEGALERALGISPQ